MSQITQLNSKEARFWCYDGVSMENITRIAEDAESKRFLDDADPYFPCNSIPERYEAVCVREHVNYAIRGVSSHKTEYARDYCMYFTNQETRNECFGAIGSFLNDAYFDIPHKIIEECKKTGFVGNTRCVQNSAERYAYSKKEQEALVMCNSLEERYRRICKDAVIIILNNI